MGDLIFILCLRNNSYILWGMRCLSAFFVILLSVIHAAWSGVIGGDAFVSADFVIENGDFYMPDSLHVSGVVKIENNGILNTDVFVNDGAILFIENHSGVNSVFDLGDGAQVVQLISDADDMSPINFNVPYSVLVDAANMLALTDVINFANGADKIILDDSVLDINGIAAGSVNNIELRGDVFLVVDSVDDLSDVPFISGVSGTGRVHVISPQLNPLFTDVARLRGGDLYLERVRVQDYEKVFNNDMGRYLNALRLKNKNDKLLYALDSAKDIDSFYSVLRHSVRLNNKMLARPLRILNAFNRFESDGVTSADVWGVMSDEFYAYGIGAGVRENIMSNLNVGIEFGIGKVNYDGDYDVYAGDLFSADLSALWNLNDSIAVRGIAGVLYQNTDVGDVFYENRVYENPDVMMWDLKADIGYKLLLADSFYLDAYTGLNFNGYSVTGFVDNDFDLYSGVNLGYEFDAVGIRYDCHIGANVNADSDIGVHGSIGFMSDMDMVGGNVNFTAIHMFDVMTYKLSLGVRFLF